LGLLPVSVLALTTLSAHAFYDPGTQRWLNRDPVGESGGLNVYSFVASSPVESVDAFGLTFIRDDWGYKTDPVRFLCNGKPYNPDDQCCQRGKIVSKIPTWQKREYPSYAACVGDSTTCSPGTFLGLGGIGLGLGIKGGTVGTVIGTAIGGFLFGDQLQSMIACSGKECPEDITNDPNPGVVVY
jgi:hypothetical protein